MSEMVGTVTQMAFEPDKNVAGLMLDLLDPFLIDRLIKSRKALAFYSTKSYLCNPGVPDIALRQFVRETEGLTLPYSSLTYNKWTMSHESDTSRLGLAIDVKIDISAETSLADRAEAFGFADDNGRIPARLSLPPNHLANGKVNANAALELKEYVNSSEQTAFVSFIERDLTE